MGDKKALTLLECLLALCLGAVIAIPLSGLLRTAQLSYRMNLGKAAHLTELRMTLFRIITELKYAEKLLQLSEHVVEFQTRHLENIDDYIETIKYEWISYELYRSVNGATAVSLNNLQDTSCIFTGYKIDASDQMVPLDIPGGDTIDDAVAVGIDLRMGYQDYDLDIDPVYLAATSLAQLRNR